MSGVTRFCAVLGFSSRENDMATTTSRPRARRSNQDLEAHHGQATTMKAIVQDQDGSPDVLGVQRLARVSGLLYLVLAVFGMFSAITLESLVVPGDAATTAA